jgi:hypothetical protein
MFRTILTAAICFFSVSALAATEAKSSNAGSEFFHQAPASAKEFTPGLTYSSTTVKFTGAKSEITGFDINLPVEYGINEMLSIGGALSYKSATNKSGAVSTDRKGLGDILISLKGTMPVSSGSPGTFKFGTDLSLSIGDDKTDSSGDENNYSGGHTLTPYVGYEMAADANTFGGKLSREVNLGDKTIDNNGAKSKVSGGETTELSVFVEHAIDSTMKFGAALAYDMIEDSKDSVGGKSEALSPIYAVKLYLPTQVGEGTLLPEIIYGSTTDDSASGTKIDSVSAWIVGVSYRMTF